MRGECLLVASIARVSSLPFSRLVELSGSRAIGKLPEFHQALWSPPNSISDDRWGVLDRAFVASPSRPHITSANIASMLPSAPLWAVRDGRCR